MKKQLTTSEIIAKYLESTQIIASLPFGEYKKNNSEYKKIDKLSKTFDQDIVLAKKVYKELLTCDCVVAQLCAASACLSLKIYIDEALKVYRKMAGRTDIGWSGFTAKAGLEAWEKKISLEQWVWEREDIT